MIYIFRLKKSIRVVAKHNNLTPFYNTSMKEDPNEDEEWKKEEADVITDLLEDPDLYSMATGQYDIFIAMSCCLTPF